MKDSCSKKPGSKKPGSKKPGSKRAVSERSVLKRPALKEGPPVRGQVSKRLLADIKLSLERTRQTLRGIEGSGPILRKRSHRMPYYGLLAARFAGALHVSRRDGDLVYYCCLFNRALPDGKKLHFRGYGSDGSSVFVCCEDEGHDNADEPSTFAIEPAYSGDVMKAGMRFGCLRTDPDGIHYHLEDVITEIGRSFPLLIIEEQSRPGRWWGTRGAN